MIAASPFAFRIEAHAGAARAGVFTTPHGPVETPAFMPVGTLATVKALDPRMVRETGAQMILANAYHLHLRPGDEIVRDLGGLHAFMAWHGPILTDSGGFQVFSLETLRTVTEEGVEFRSHIDGSRRFFSPEAVMQIERNLGADVIMQFDHVIPGQSPESLAREASERSIRWLERCLVEFRRLSSEPVAAEDSSRGTAEGTEEKTDEDAEELHGVGFDGRTGSRSAPEKLETGRPMSGLQALFPILQGGVYAQLRREAGAAIADMADWAGFGIGGLSVGEPKPDMYAMLEVSDEALPRNRPRYLMGVGFPEDLVESVARGVDLFDCVAPTRMGRNGTAFTGEGRLNVRRAELRADRRPLDERCGCSTCARFSRAYIRHLFMADEMLGASLLSLHNVHFLVALMGDARAAIRTGAFDGWSRDWLARHHSRPAPVP